MTLQLLWVEYRDVARGDSQARKCDSSGYVIVASSPDLIALSSPEVIVASSPDLIALLNR